MVCVLEEHSCYARTAIFNVFYLPNHWPSSVWTAQAGRGPCVSPLWEGDLPPRWERWSFVLTPREAETKQWANTSPGSVAPRDAAFLGVKGTPRFKAEKL